MRLEPELLQALKNAATASNVDVSEFVRLTLMRAVGVTLQTPESVFATKDELEELQSQFARVLQGMNHKLNTLSFELQQTRLEIENRGESGNVYRGANETK